MKPRYMESNKFIIDTRKRNIEVARSLNRFTSSKEANRGIMGMNRNTSLIMWQKDIGRCAICLQDFEMNDIVRATVCGHNYHAKCIERSLEDISECPICKKNILDVSI